MESKKSSTNKPKASPYGARQPLYLNSISDATKEELTYLMTERGYTQHEAITIAIRELAQKERSKLNQKEVAAAKY